MCFRLLILQWLFFNFEVKSAHSFLLTEFVSPYVAFQIMWWQIVQNKSVQCVPIDLPTKFCYLNFICTGHLVNVKLPKSPKLQASNFLVGESHPGAQKWGFPHIYLYIWVGVTPFWNKDNKEKKSGSTILFLATAKKMSWAGGDGEGDNIFLKFWLFS